MDWPNLTGYVGRNFLRGANRRTTCPPGELVPNGNPGIIVATPPRSGTHVAINLLLNNLPSYRREPLYIELDALQRRRRLGNMIDQMQSGPGHVMKTHFPITFPPREELKVQMRKIAEANVVVVVRRDVDAIERSIKAWWSDEKLKGGLAYFVENPRSETERFWSYWQDFEVLEVAFDDLLDPDAARAFLARVAVAAGIPEPVQAAPVRVAKGSRSQVLLNKGLTRLVGARAPLIDTSIRALRPRSS